MRDTARDRATREWVASLLYDVWHGDGRIIAYAVPWSAAYATKQAHGGGARITVAQVTAPAMNGHRGQRSTKEDAMGSHEDRHAREFASLDRPEWGTEPWLPAPEEDGHTACREFGGCSPECPWAPYPERCLLCTQRPCICPGSDGTTDPAALPVPECAGEEES